jgi:hypothetical protein
MTNTPWRSASLTIARSTFTTCSSSHARQFMLQVSPLAHDAAGQT